MDQDQIVNEEIEKDLEEMLAIIPETIMLNKQINVMSFIEDNYEYLNHMMGKCACFTCSCGSCRCYFKQARQKYMTGMQSVYQGQISLKGKNINSQSTFYNESPQSQAHKLRHGQPIFTNDHMPMESSNMVTPCPSLSMLIRLLTC